MHGRPNIGVIFTRALSNLEEPSASREGTAELVVGSEGFPVWVFNTNDGSIRAFVSNADSMSRVVRSAGTGSDTASGVYFEHLIRAEPLEGLGFFAFSDLVVPEDTRIVGIGRRPLVILAQKETLTKNPLGRASCR